MSDLAGDAEKSPQTKIALRARLLTARRLLSAAERSAAAVKIQDQVRLLVRRTAPRTIAAYVPVGSEPGGSALPYVLAEELPAGGRLLLPILLPDGDLDWAPFSTLAEGPRGLLEPVGPRSGTDAIRGADLVLVPALAVDRTGMRMGRGGGSYDRALSRLPEPGPITVALLHDGEDVDAVPAEPHDRPVMAVMTPTGGFSLRPDPEWTN
ncbi:5-formyltetrahydrofolate cyclo-ligase [Actinoplanes sp. GCM10030250]|uniref:5-formyltetrahydrofolate cyclo-ligase n=1 Tax=Actinoplanes sp. GCM10030250 TaxID=3273376 RepID=UPI00361039DC